MWGTRFLSAFLKVNPYFTVVLAVGFSGVAAVGFKDTETAKSLKNLIPLNLQPTLASHPPDDIVADLPAAIQSREIIRNILLPQASGAFSDSHSFANILQSDPLKTHAAGRWQDLAVAQFIDPFWYGLPGIPPSRPEQDPAEPLIQAPPPTKAPDPTLPAPAAPLVLGNGLGPVIPAFASARQDRPPQPLSFVQDPPLAQPIIPPADTVPVVGVAPAPAPDIIPPPPVLPPTPSPAPGPGVVFVDVAEPSMTVAFAALLPLLFRLRRRPAERISG